MTMLTIEDKMDLYADFYKKFWEVDESGYGLYHYFKSGDDPITASEASDIMKQFILNLPESALYASIQDIIYDITENHTYINHSETVKFYKILQNYDGSGTITITTKSEDYSGCICHDFHTDYEECNCCYYNHEEEEDKTKVYNIINKT